MYVVTVNKITLEQVLSDFETQENNMHALLLSSHHHAHTYLYMKWPTVCNANLITIFVEYFY